MAGPPASARGRLNDARAAPDRSWPAAASGAPLFRGGCDILSPSGFRTGRSGARVASDAPAMAASRFLLKIAPPKLGRALPQRPRLERLWSVISDRTAIVVTAPQGFGKTTLLAQWRRRWLERGAYVAWITLDAQDDRAQFVDLLAFALAQATGRESFELAAKQGHDRENRELEALTTLLAEVATLATPTVLVLDDVHRMPTAALGSLLTYLLNNAPPNLQFLIGTRRPLDLQLSDLMAAGQLAALGPPDLRLDADESREVLRARFGARIGLDEAARVFELTEGWPLGLQLAADTIERSADAGVALGELSARRGDIQRFFFESMLSRLPADAADFFVRSAILETMNADLCAAVTGHPDAAGLLEAAPQVSPVVVQTETPGWLRLHGMARDFLLGQFDRLPVAERNGCYERAAAWYAANGQYQEAARHAWAAGNVPLAISHATRCLRDIASEGRLGEARDWIRRIPAAAMARDVELQLTVAWIQALGEAPQGVPEAIDRILARPDLDDRARFEAAIVSSASAQFCDRVGVVLPALAPWQPPPPRAPPLHVFAIANSIGMCRMLSGEPARGREVLLAHLATAPRDPGMRLVTAFMEFAVALSHLLECNAVRAETLLAPQLVAAERDMGRRSLIAAMCASLLGTARALQGDYDGALALLADRLDVVERIGLPEPIIFAYRVIAEVAIRRGEEARAIEAWSSLRELGAARGLPRLEVMALTGNAMVHARGLRTETASACLAEAVGLRALFDAPEYRPLAPRLDQRIALARACILHANGDYEGVVAALDPSRQGLGVAARNPDGLAARAMRAVALHRLGLPGAHEVLNEALGLAEIGGARNYVETFHPAVAELLATVRPVPVSSRAVVQPEPAQRPPADVAAVSGLLTPKEAQILSLLAGGLANKEIARAMDIGEQTVKWHLKNVFFKLNAASRRHAVDRARLLGLLSA